MAQSVLPTNQAHWLVKLLARVLIVYPSKIEKYFERSLQLVQKPIGKIRNKVASWLGSISSEVVIINGKLVGKKRTPTCELAREILGNHCTQVLDVGARWGSENSWWRMNGFAKFVGFDPDELECERLNKKLGFSETEKYIPVALGSINGLSHLYLAHQPACSSLYPPSADIMERYPATLDQRTEKIIPVQLRRLDDWWKEQASPEICFIKLDTQGSELDILKNGRELLSHVLGCEIEVEFSPMYEGQPLFHHVDAFMREQGFVLWSLDEMTKHREKPRYNVSSSENVFYEMNKYTSEFGRLFWGKALYFRDYNTMSVQGEAWKQHLIWSALLDSYGDVDSARSCLRSLVENADSFTAQHILEKIKLHARDLF